MPATPAWPPASTPRLFIDQPLGPDAAPHIDGAAAHYLLNVMRLRVGDPLLLFDNRSGEWLGRIADAGRRSLDIAIEALKIAHAGLRRRAKADACGTDESGFIEPLLEIAEANETPAERKLALFHGEWKGSVDPVFREFAY